MNAIGALTRIFWRRKRGWWSLDFPTIAMRKTWRWSRKTRRRCGEWWRERARPPRPIPRLQCTTAMIPAFPCRILFLLWRDASRSCTNHITLNDLLFWNKILFLWGETSTTTRDAPHLMLLLYLHSLCVCRRERNVQLIIITTTTWGLETLWIYC